MLRRLVVANRHRGLRREDAFIASYPRSGNTWLRFVLADLVTGVPVDFEMVEQVIPNVGAHSRAPKLSDGGRLIKTHEAHRPSYGRAVYLVRDVRDVLISWYRVTREDPDDLSDLEDFVADFVTSRASPYGSWHHHVNSWLEAERMTDAIRVYHFEELRGDPVSGIGEITSFLGIAASPGAIGEAVARNSARRMRRLESQNLEFLQRSFGRMSTGVREGAVGKWRELLTERHREALGPALALNTRLGYDGSGTATP